MTLAIPATSPATPTGSDSALLGKRLRRCGLTRYREPMRRTITVLALCTVVSVGMGPTASAAPYRSCANVTKMAGGKKLTLATMARVKEHSCKDAKAVVIDYVVAGAMIADPVLVGLRRHMAPQYTVRVRPQAAHRREEAGRAAATCSTADGKKSVKA